MLKSIIISSLSLGTLVLSSDTSTEKVPEMKTISSSIYIETSIDHLWQKTALEFDKIGIWSASLDHSSAGNTGNEFPGISCTERVCSPNQKGLSKTVERIIDVKAEQYQFTYEIAQGLPSFVGYATNTWQLEPEGNGVRMSMTAKMELKGFLAWLMGGIMERKMENLLNENLEELKYYVEHGEVHPRKAKLKSSSPLTSVSAL